MTHLPFITFSDAEYDIAMRYSDNVARYETQLPLALSWLTYSGFVSTDVLFNDDSGQYLLYPSGTNITQIQIQTSDRYSGLTATLLSGQTNLYIQISEYFSDQNPAFIGAPYTVSGETFAGDLILATYTPDTPANPENYWISLPGPGTYKIAFPSPIVGNSITVTHSGQSSYLLGQLLPRKSVQGYDLEVNTIKTYHLSASVINTIALQVSDSIVVGPDLIGAKSIDGSKIVDGTISGVLIQNGTVTGNKILAGTISGSLIQAGTITADNIASDTITASKIAGATITFDKLASKTLTADQIADSAVTGRLIQSGTISGVLITNNSITASNIAGATITGDKIQANTISGALITAGTITSTQIATSGITAINMAANSITADNINARVITADKIVLSGITAELLGAEAVTAAALASGAVVSGKIAADSIYASNIVGGQITGYHVAANTITGDRLNVNQLDAVAANMGTLVVNSGISIGTNGYIWTGTGEVETPDTGLKIYTTAGNSRLTTYNGGDVQVDISSDGKLTAGNGNVALDSTGISIGSITTANPASEALRILGSGGAGNIVGMAFYNGSFSPINPQITIQADSVNALEIENNAVNGITNFNFPASGIDNGATVNIYNGNLFLKRTPIPFVDNITPGALIGYDSDDTVRYKLGSDGIVLNNNTDDTFTVNAANGRVHTVGNLHVGPGDHVFTVNGTSGDVHVGAPPHVFTVDGSSGDVTSEGNIFALDTITAYSELKSSYLGYDYAFKVNTNGKLSTRDMGYLTARRTAALAITTAGTTITWQAYPRYNNISVAGSEITIANAGYYTFSATFSTQANIASLRMTLQRGTISYVSTLHGAGLATGGGYIFNFSIGFWSPANTDYRVVLTPASNTTLVVNNEGFAAPSPIINIYQAIGDIE